MTPDLLTGWADALRSGGPYAIITVLCFVIVVLYRANLRYQERTVEMAVSQMRLQTQLETSISSLTKLIETFLSKDR